MKIQKVKGGRASCPTLPCRSSSSTPSLPEEEEEEEGEYVPNSGSYLVFVLNNYFYVKIVTNQYINYLSI